MNEKTCEWTVKDYESLSDCNPSVDVINSIFNTFNFCPFCGGEIVIKEDVRKDMQLNKFNDSHDVPSGNFQTKI
jgi:hypothetical protein